jgi:hypothetical protein
MGIGLLVAGAGDSCGRGAAIVAAEGVVSLVLRRQRKSRKQISSHGQ